MGVENHKNVEGISHPEERERVFGRNVEINAIFMRHGEKEMSGLNPETALSPEGERQSIEFGRGLKKRDAIKPFSSNTDRTIRTVELVTKESNTEKKMKPRLKDELWLHYSTQGAFFDAIKKFRKEILGADLGRLPRDEQNKRLREYEQKSQDYYLEFGDKRPDAKTYSPVETAALIARRVDLYMRMADRLYSNSEVDLVNATHDHVLAAFLHEVMLREKDGKQVRGFDSVEEIGGPMDFVGSFDVKIRTDENGNKNQALLFRGHEYSMDMKRLQELVTISEELESREGKV